MFKHAEKLYMRQIKRDGSLFLVTFKRNTLIKNNEHKANCLQTQIYIYTNEIQSSQLLFLLCHYQWNRKAFFQRTIHSKQTQKTQFYQPQRLTKAQTWPCPIALAHFPSSCWSAIVWAAVLVVCPEWVTQVVMVVRKLRMDGLERYFEYPEGMQTEVADIVEEILRQK